MKIINHNEKTNLKLISLFILLLINFSSIKSQCNEENGCLFRKKFKSFVWAEDKMGRENLGASKLNYKHIYVFKDRISFTSSRSMNEPTLEGDITYTDAKKAESVIEKTINFDEIMLSCGPSEDKLCHFSEYSESPLIKAEKGSKEQQNAWTSFILTSNLAQPEDQCIVIPYFSYSYLSYNQKIAYICVQNVVELSALIDFKNILSSLIGEYQEKQSLDKGSSLNGIVRSKSKWAIFESGSIVKAVGKVTNSNMIFYRFDNDINKREFYEKYSFYQLKGPNSGIQLITPENISKKVVPDNWKDLAATDAVENCCIIFKAEPEEDKYGAKSKVLCLLNDLGTIEKEADVCLKKLKPFINDFKSILRGIKKQDVDFKVFSNSLIRNDCNSQEYKFYEAQLNKVRQYAVSQCKLMAKYNLSKVWGCKTQYKDYILQEINNLSGNKPDIKKAIDKCLIQSKKISYNQDNPDIIEIEAIAQLKASASGKNPSSSFIELEAQTNDDDDFAQTSTPQNDDEEIFSSEKEQNRVFHEQAKPVIKKIIDSNDSSNEMVNLIEKKINNKPKVINKLEESKSDVMRKELQKKKNKKFTQNFKMRGVFDHNKAAMGKKNTDTFVAFLGYLNDADKESHIPKPIDSGVVGSGNTSSAKSTGESGAVKNGSKDAKSSKERLNPADM